MLCLTACAPWHGAQGADEVNLWTLRPYAVRVAIIADTTSVPPGKVTAAAARHFESRAASVVGPLWNLTVSAPESAEADSIRQVLETSDIQQLPALPPASEPSEDQDTPPEESGPLPFEPAIGAGQDKLLLIEVKETLFGFEVRSVEYDLYLRRLGSIRMAEAATNAGVPEAVFRVACEVFSPVAIFSINRDDYHYASLVFRGAELPTPAGSPQWFAEQDVFLPMLRRTNREGVVPAGGVQPAPWTLLQVTKAAPAPTARVLSHTRRPFGSRRRGRIEQLAIRMPLVAESTRLRLAARDNPEQSLAGYHVYARDSKEGELLELGATDKNGEIEVARTDAVVRTLFVKSGSKLVAKLPIAPGAEAELTASLVDERKRIEAEARLSLLREELIDLVARRNILIARTRAAIDGQDFDKAKRFVNELEGLPSLNVYNQRLTEQEQLSRARDPAVQARIDKLFEQTREVLGAFLSSREITELRSDLSDATKQAAR